jgi:hypothetical protein
MPTPKPAAKTARTRSTSKKNAAPEITPLYLIARAMEKGLPAETIAGMMDWAERQRAADAEREFIQAMLDLKTNDLPEILRDASGEIEGDLGQMIDFDYATLYRLCEKLIPALAKHGIVHSYETPEDGSISAAGRLRITAVLSHKLGHRARATLEAPPDTTDGKNGIQAIGSASTYLQRYTLLLACGIAVKQQHDADAPGATIQRRAGAVPGQDDRRQAPRMVTYVTEGAHPINGPDLAKAIGNIKARRYTYAQLVQCYALTRDQLEQVHRELEMPAPAEEIPS